MKTRVRPNRWGLLGHLPDALRRKVSMLLRRGQGQQRPSRLTSLSTSESREGRSRSTDMRRSYGGIGRRDRREVGVPDGNSMVQRTIVANQIGNPPDGKCSISPQGSEKATTGDIEVIEATEEVM